MRSPSHELGIGDGCGVPHDLWEAHPCSVERPGPSSGWSVFTHSSIWMPKHSRNPASAAGRELLAIGWLKERPLRPSVPNVLRRRISPSLVRPRSTRGVPRASLPFRARPAHRRTDPAPSEHRLPRDPPRSIGLLDPRRPASNLTTLSRVSHCGAFPSPAPAK